MDGFSIAIYLTLGAGGGGGLLQSSCSDQLQIGDHVDSSSILICSLSHSRLFFFCVCPPPPATFNMNNGLQR